MVLSVSELVLRSAARLFAQKGFFDTTMKEIALHAGVAVGSIYNYYSSKEALLDALYAHELVERRSLIGRLSSAGLSAGEQLEEFVNDHFQRLQANPDLAKVLVSERRAAELNCPSSREFRQMLVGFLSGLVDAGERDDAAAIAMLAAGALEAATTMAQTQTDQRSAQSFADTARCYRSFCIRGMPLK